MLKNCNFWNYKWDYWRRLIAMHRYDGNKISSLQRCHFFNQCFRYVQQWTKVYDPGRLPVNKWVCFSTWRGLAFPANFSLWNWFWRPSIFASYFFFLCRSDLVYFTFACVACHLLFLSSYFPSSQLQLVFSSRKSRHLALRPLLVTLVSLLPPYFSFVYIFISNHNNVKC